MLFTQLISAVFSRIPFPRTIAHKDIRKPLLKVTIETCQAKPSRKLHVQI